MRLVPTSAFLVKGWVANQEQQMPQPPKQPPQKHPEMSDEEWQDHLEEVRAFERRNFRQSGGRVRTNPSKDSPEERS